MWIGKALVGALILGLLAVSHQLWGLKGLVVAFSGLVMWGLLHLNRMMTVLKRSADQPLGWVGSAVMLHAKLKKGVNLLHVMALTRSMGERLSAENADPEVYRWTDNGGSTVTCEFQRGRLVQWTLWRPDSPDQPVAAPSPASPQACPPT